MMVTRGADIESCVLNKRPRSSGIPITRKYFGLTETKLAFWIVPRGKGGFPAIVKGRLAKPWASIGRGTPRAESCKPG